MIIGRGAIASVLTDSADKIFFASGVADSGDVSELEYVREMELLSGQPSDRRLVYFSSLCVFTMDSRYSKHKRTMEYLVKKWFPKYCIMRLGNAEWASNPKQLIPFIRRRLLTEEPFHVYDEYRHLLSLKEFLYWVNQIPDWNCEMNVTGELIKIADLIQRYKRG